MGGQDENDVVGVGPPSGVTNHEPHIMESMEVGPDVKGVEDYVAVENLDKYGKVHIAKVGPSDTIPTDRWRAYCTWVFGRDGSDFKCSPANSEFDRKRCTRCWANFLAG